MASGKTHSRGFVFTMMALAVLTFMLLSMQIWIRSFERSDENSAAKFKGEAIRLVLSSLSDAQLSRFANASAYYATFKLVNYSSYSDIADDVPANDTLNPKTGRIERALKGLIVNGSAEVGSSPGERINYSDEEKEAYTIASWKEKVNSAANLMGFRTNFSDPKNLTVRQLDAWTVGVSFDMQMNVTDLEGTMRQSKMMRADTNFSIEGFYDPFITRNDIKQRRPEPVDSEAEQKQIFRKLGNQPYNVPSDLAPNSFPGTEGNGWFAGPATSDRPGTGIFLNFTEQARMKQYIYVTGYYEGLVEDANRYGAVILTQTPGTNLTLNAVVNGCLYNVTTQTSCLNCQRSYSPRRPGCDRDTEYFDNVSVPYISVGGFSLGNLKFVHRTGLDNQGYYALIDNNFRTYQYKLDDDYHKVWDLTKIRDMTICGFYVKSDTQSAPSFFQRMLASAGRPSPAGAISSPAYGIETLLLGTWAGGALDKGVGNSYENDNRPRVDWEFYSSTDYATTAYKIRGMAGCKTEEMCKPGNDSAITESVGKFRVTASDAGRYGIVKIACNPAERCEPLGN